jgi:hypothetical protein
MASHYVNRFAVECGWGTGHQMLPEAELWTEVILQAIDDMDRRTSPASRSAEVLLANGLLLETTA